MFVAGWLGRWVFIATVYSHHLYMDFVQPRWAEVISTVSSYASLLPVAVITIYSMTMLVWGSAYRWTLASTPALRRPCRLGDRRQRGRHRLDDPDQLPPPQHRLGRRPLPHLPDADGRRLGRSRSSRTCSSVTPDGRRRALARITDGRAAARRRLRPDRHVVRRGRARYSAPLRDPTARHERLQPRGQRLRTGVRARLPRLHRPARPARAGGLEATPLRRGAHVADGGTTHARGRRSTRLRCRGALSHSAAGRGPAQLRSAVAACVVALAAFFPQVVDASEASIRYHHLDHAGQFFFGTMLGLVLGSLPAVSRRLGDRLGLGLAAVLVAPMVMMLVMVPRFYEPLERHPVEHAALPRRDGRLRARHRARREQARPRGRPSPAFLAVGDGAHVRRRDERRMTMSDPDIDTIARGVGRTLALAARRHRWRRRRSSGF